MPPLAEAGVASRLEAITGQSWRPSRTPVAATVALLSLLAVVPYAVAALTPPPGRVFVGTFHWVDDVYNYASFARQAEDGQVLFWSKLAGPQSPRVILNLEWWLWGVTSRLLGHRPFLAFRLLGSAGGLLLLLGLARWLRASGLPDSHRVAGLVLLGAGGGLGGLLFLLTDLPAWRCLELYSGLSPFVMLLSNPHWTLATALLIWALETYALARGWGGWLLGGLLGTLLGLSRPYDVVTLGAARGLGILIGAPPGRWLKEALPLLGLAPVTAYNAWVYLLIPGRTSYAASSYAQAFPRLVDFLPAFLPALVLMLLARPFAFRANWAQTHLLGWIVFGLFMVAVRPTFFSAQVLVGWLIPFLCLGARSLARLSPIRALAVALAFCTTSAVAVRIVLAAEPYWFVPAERLAAAQAMAPLCRRGDVLWAPPDISLYAMAWSACSPYAAHEAVVGYPQRLAEIRLFYGVADPSTRRRLLDGACVTHLVLHDGSLTLNALLGEASRFAETGSVGSEENRLTVYQRPAPPGCARSSGD